MSFRGKEKHINAHGIMKAAKKTNHTRICRKFVVLH